MTATTMVIVIRNCGFGKKYSGISPEQIVYECEYREDYQYGGDSGSAFLQMYDADKFIFCKD